MKKNSPQHSVYRGFSLAEALITLLIVCIITLASVPVITKKKRDLNTGHGFWMCTLDENGKAVYISKNSTTWTQSNTTNKCTFTPPQNARNFEITIVGGGGGGASGNSTSEDIVLTNGSSRTITAPGTGSYEAYLIGGGGCGGNRKNNANRCKENPGGPGASGGFVHKILNISKGQSVNIMAGKGGAGSTDKGGNNGTDSYVRNTSTNYDLARATGGKGGQSRRGAACGKRDEDGNRFINGGKCGNPGCPGKAGSPNGVVGWTLGKDGDNTQRSVPGHLCTSQTESLSGSIDGVKCSTLLKDIISASAKEFEYGPKGSINPEYTGTRYALPYGYGGKGQSTGQTSGPTDGGPGYARFRYNLVEAGGGGKNGEVNRPAVIPSLKKVIAYPGRGGQGAQYANTNGYNGETTSCSIEAKDYTTEKPALGGNGGTYSYTTATSAEDSDFISGQIGGTSPVKLRNVNATGGLGGFQNGNSSEHGLSVDFKNRNFFGAGGGGGGANKSVWGKGGNGAPGAVIIEW